MHSKLTISLNSKFEFCRLSNYQYTGKPYVFSSLKPIYIYGASTAVQINKNPDLSLVFFPFAFFSFLSFLCWVAVGNLFWQYLVNVSATYTNSMSDIFSLMENLYLMTYILLS